MRERHLRLVISHCKNYKKHSCFEIFFEKFQCFLQCIFISKSEKIFMIKDALIQIYRDYEISTGIIDIPYFVRAEKRISQIIRDKKINYYYNKLKKFYKH